MIITLIFGLLIGGASIQAINYETCKSKFYGKDYKISKQLHKQRNHK